MQGVPPFGLIVPGEPPVFHFTQTTPTQWSLTLNRCPSSFLFFLSMSEPLPAGYGLSIYLASSAAPEGGFTFLGAVFTSKPSALFEVPASLLPSGTAPAGVADASTLVVGVGLETEDFIRNMLSGTSGGAPSPASAGFGGGFGPSQQQQQQQQPYGAGAFGSAVCKSNNATKYAIGEKVLEEFCNFVTSFVKTVSPQTLPTLLADILNNSSQNVTGASAVAEEYVLMPVSFVDSWRQRMEKKMKANASSF